MCSDSIDLGGKFTYMLHQRKLGFGVKEVSLSSGSGNSEIFEF